MRIKWRGLIQALTLLGAIGFAIPAFWGAELNRFNGLDLAAAILFISFLVSCYVEKNDQ